MNDPTHLVVFGERVVFRSLLAINIFHLQKHCRQHSISDAIVRQETMPGGSFFSIGSIQVLRSAIRASDY